MLIQARHWEDMCPQVPDTGDPRGLLLMCFSSFPQKEFQFLQEATLGTGASRSPHILIFAGKEHYPFSNTSITSVSLSLHITSSKSSLTSPTLSDGVGSLPSPYTLLSDEGQACVSPS